MEFELPDTMVPISTSLRAVSEARPDEIALVFVPEHGAESVFTWREIDERSTLVARTLAERGLGLGHRLAISIRNAPEHVLAAIAAWKVGAVPVPVRWDLPDWELDRVMEVLAPDQVITPDDPVLAPDLAGSIEPLPEVISPNASGLLSSGSTGSPKVILRLMPGVVDTEQSSNRLIEEYAPLGPQTVIVPAPLYHNNGFMALGNLVSGDRLVLLERFDPDRILEVIERHRITGMVATTVMLQRLARADGFATRDLSSLDWVMHGAAPLPDWLARTWIDRVGPEHFFVCYGSSEGVGATFARGDEYLAHPGTVGRPAMGAQIKILDDDGVELPTGEVGHIYMKPEIAIMAAYVGDVPPIPVTDDGYATVGDLGSLDADGYLHLADRRVDLIITGGANVFPAEVEAAISEHPDVADTVVIGLSDPEWGRRVHAIVVRSPGSDLDADELRDYVGERLARYKIPKTVEFVDEIPRSEATKLNRAALIAEREPPSEESS